MTATTEIAPPTTTARDCSWGGDGEQLGRDDDRPDPSATSNCLWGGQLVCQTRRYDTGNSEDRDDSDQNDDNNGTPTTTTTTTTTTTMPTTPTPTTDRCDRDDPASPQHPPTARQAPRREDEDDDGHHHHSTPNHRREQRLVGWKRAALTMEREQDNNSNRDNGSRIMTPSPHFAWGQVFFSLFCIVAPPPSHLPQGGGFSFLVYIII